MIGRRFSSISKREGRLVGSHSFKHILGQEDSLVIKMVKTAEPIVASVDEEHDIFGR